MLHLVSQFLEVALYVVIIFSLIVFIHELGHFIPARRLGVKVDAFSIGFGKEIFGFYDKHGTRWKFSLIPLGGYVQFFGDDDPASQGADNIHNMSEEDKKKCLHFRPVWQRVLVSLGGPLGNYVLAFVMATFVYSFMGQPAQAPVIGYVVPNSYAAEIGLQKADEIKTINDQEITEFSQAQKMMAREQELRIEVMRNKELQIINFKTATPFEKSPAAMGLAPRLEFDFHNPEGLVQGAKHAALFVTHVTKQIMYTIGNLIIGKGSSDSLSGPVGIARVIKQASETGYDTLVMITILLSISLGFFNLLPMPPLDGGHIMLALIEKMRGGRRLSKKVEERIFAIGISLVVALMLFSTFKDLLKIGE